jgi:hypothetical protein
MIKACSKQTSKELKIKSRMEISVRATFGLLNLPHLLVGEAFIWKVDSVLILVD